jgi:hypothetical protein
MKNRKEFLIFKRLLGQNRAQPMHTARARPVVAWAQHRNAWPDSGDARPARCGPTACLRSPQASEADPGAAPARRSVARAARSTADGARATLHRGTLGSERLWHEPRQSLDREHPRRTANPPDMVVSSSSKRGRQAMEGRSSPVRSTAPELNDGEGACPSGWGAALGSGEALGPTYGERGGMIWLGTNRAVENRGGATVTAYRREGAVGAQANR